MMAAESERCDAFDFETDEPTTESGFSGCFVNVLLNAASSPTDECMEDRGVRDRLVTRDALLAPVCYPVQRCVD